MLERAVRCVENASQHVYLGSRHTIRSRRTLHPNFWSYNIDGIALLLCGADASHSPSPPSNGSTLTRRRNNTNFSDLPLSSAPLEFLYPPQTRSFARGYVHSSKKILNHGRKRRGSSRGYSASADREYVLDSASHDDHPNGYQLEENLRKFLSEEGLRDYDMAWHFYKSAGSPSSVASILLRYLSTSTKHQDLVRCQAVFDKIPLSVRDEHDYLNAVKVALHNEGGSGSLATEICQEAVSNSGRKSCWYYAFTTLVERADWDNVLSLWNNRPDPLIDKLQHLESPQFKTLPDRLFSLLKGIEDNKFEENVDNATGLAKYIFRLIVSSDKSLMDMSMQTILRMFESLLSSGLLEPDDYIATISTLSSSSMRSAKGRSILVYRNFRWRLPDAPPSERLILKLLRMLSTLEIFEGIYYLLRDYRLFYGKPSPRAYHHALTTFARLGEASHVKNAYHNYLRDHGKSSHPGILSPLLYVHARVGEVEETQKWFDIVSKELGDTPDVTYWNILLTAHSRNKDMDAAIQTFRQMLDSNISPDSVSFTILMGLAAGRGDTEAVLYLLNVVKKSGVTVTRMMFDTVVETLCRNKKYSDAERVAEEAALFFPAKSLARTWNVLLWNYAFNVDVASISRAQDRMQEIGVTFDGMTYAALMLSLVRVGNTDSARQILGILHRNHKIYLSVFHYAILLHGYVHENNRDMVQVLYLEMLERFEHTSLSAKLAMLKTQIDRDIRNLREKAEYMDTRKIGLPHAEKFLDSIMRDFDIRAYSTKQPQPGARGRAPRDTFPAAYYEQVIQAYGSENKVRKVGDLFLELSDQTRSLFPEGKPPSTRVIHSLMVNYLNQGRHYEVKRCFEAALSHVLELSRPISVQQALSPASTAGPRQSSYYDDVPNVLSSRRFELSHCLSIYMQSLYRQKLHSKIANIVKQVERYGFKLTTHNWSLYVNLLCLSREPSSQLLAFTIFEEKFMPNYPGWTNIKLGYAIRPEHAHKDIDLVEGVLRRGKRRDMMGKKGRKLWANIEPDYMQPTHLNVLHLASALVDFRSRSIIDSGTEMLNLYSAAPETYKAIATIPFLEEKFQGILHQCEAHQERLARRTEVDLPNNSTRTGGILGPEGERIDTRPTQPIYEEEGDDDFYDDQYGSDVDTMWPEHSESTEPESPLLESLLEEDQSRRNAELAEEEGRDVALAAERTLTPEDEWALDNEKRLLEKANGKSDN